MPDLANDLIAQLKDPNFFQNTSNSKQNSVEPITEDKAIEFVLQRSGEIVDQSVDLLQTIKERVESTGDAEEITAYAGLLASISGAIDNINKLVITNKKIKGMKEIKQMEIDAKVQIEEKSKNNVFIGSREEIIKFLMKEAKIIDVQPVTEKPTETDHLMLPSVKNQTDSSEDQQSL